jgi:hypothetical protein
MNTKATKGGFQHRSVFWLFGLWEQSEAVCAFRGMGDEATRQRYLYVGLGMG